MRKSMPFIKEPTGYEKTILSDLQGAWIILRESIVESGGFEGADRVLFHIDEAMSWEIVRNLRLMPPLVIVIRNLCIKAAVPEEILENIQEIDSLLKETLSELNL
jgi:hypothetical protein